MTSHLSPSRMPIALTLVNLIILLATLGVIVTRDRTLTVPSVTSDGVLRGRGLQIVDDEGKVRASISILAASKQPDGSTYPETVLLRMITSQGRPVVKIASTEDGSGISLMAAEGLAYAQILARGGNPRAVMVDAAGKEISKLP